MNKGVPYYDVDFINDFDLVNEAQVASYIDIADCNDADFWVKLNGEIVALKKIEDWEASLVDGKVYVIRTKDCRTVIGNKILEDIYATSIKEVYQVLGCIRVLI